MIREGAIRIPFRYAAGRAGSRFLANLRDERRIMGGRCGDCGGVHVPLRSWCPTCGGQRLFDQSVGPEATVVCATARADGEVFALLKLDGADTPMVHRLIGEAATGGMAAAGARVRARFAAHRRADIRDIEGFEAMEGPSS